MKFRKVEGHKNDLEEVEENGLSKAQPKSNVLSKWGIWTAFILFTFGVFEIGFNIGKDVGDKKSRSEISELGELRKAKGEDAKKIANLDKSIKEMTNINTELQERINLIGSKTAKEMKDKFLSKIQELSNENVSTSYDYQNEELELERYFEKIRILCEEINKVFIEIEAVKLLNSEYSKILNPHNFIKEKEDILKKDVLERLKVRLELLRITS